MNTELTIKIIQLVISASIPVIIFILGVSLTRKIENAKVETQKKHYWDNRLADTFFDKFKIYTENVAGLIAKLELIRILIKNGTQNDDNGKLLHAQLVEIVNLTFTQAIELEIYANNLFEKENDVVKTLKSLNNMIADLMNTKQGNVTTIYEELEKLNNVTGIVFNRTQT